MAQRQMCWCLQKSQREDRILWKQGLRTHSPRSSQFLLSTPVSWHLRALGEKFENYYSGAMSAAIKSYGQTDLKKNLCCYPKNKHFHIYLQSCGLIATIWL